MAGALFGKLPAKRDFVTHNVSRAFLDVWEPWLQRGVATSRQMLGADWQDAFRSAPIWRFWLGAGFCGTPVIGAFMPSVDGVGRYFPLTVYCVEQAGLVLPPPELDLHAGWFEAVEDCLLGALQQDATYDDLVASVEALPPPNASPSVSAIAGMTLLPDGGVVIRDFDNELASAFRIARRLDQRRSYAGQSFWWTIGGEGYPPTAIAETRLPPPTVFADMLTGNFASTTQA